MPGTCVYGLLSCMHVAGKGHVLCALETLYPLLKSCIEVLLLLFCWTPWGSGITLMLTIHTDGLLGECSCDHNQHFQSSVLCSL
jgi:hypothetical protein